MDSLSDRLKKLRISAGLTQTELGKIIGVGKTTISMYETGNSTPSDEIKLKIAEFFNISVDYLFGKTDIKNHESTNLKYSAQTSLEDELFAGFRLLSKDDQEEIIEILRMKLRKVKREANAKLSNSANTKSNNLVG
jgi:transcriptional regulator with XRE-family HTH domain